MRRPNAPAAALATLAAALLAPGPARAANLHERGVIASVEGPVVRVTTREGKAVSLDLDDGWTVAGVERGSMADIKPGTFIGTATAEDADGAQALEVVVFPEAMRGAGEGHYGWDLQPKSMMTNANVEKAVRGVDGQTVTLSYKGGETKVVIADGTPIVRPAGATRADLVAGAKVFVSSPAEAGDGRLAKGTIVVGRDGLTPPM